MFHSSVRSGSAPIAASASALLALTLAAGAQISTVPTTDPLALKAALNGPGLTITSVIVRNGMAGQFGTFSGFSQPPVTIENGIVLSSGSVANLGPMAETLAPDYDPASPPEAVNSQMYLTGTGATGTFNSFGQSGGIDRFDASFDVASLEVQFTLAQSAQVKFDFIFASVEFPEYTGRYTDAFLVFLDGNAPANQIAFDAHGNPVQVDRSFAGLTVTNDVNTAFAAPHGLIHHLTTTTSVLPAGPHTLRFEVGDVNDAILDSAAFISNLRTGSGVVGTRPTEDCNNADLAGPNQSIGEDGSLTADDIIVFLAYFFSASHHADFAGPNQSPVPDNAFTADDIIVFLGLYFAGC